MSLFHAPVNLGDEHEVTIDTVGDEGDGIARVEHGFVIIVPNGQPGDELLVEITGVHENYAFAQIVRRLD